MFFRVFLEFLERILVTALAFVSDVEVDLAMAPRIYLFFIPVSPILSIDVVADTYIAFTFFNEFDAGSIAASLVSRTFSFRGAVLHRPLCVY